MFDGDGSVLMNLGGLTTLARYRPPNLVHVVFDNESLLSVGGFPTATSTGSDLAGDGRRRRRAAHGHGARRSTRSPRRSTTRWRARELTTLVAKVEAVGPDGVRHRPGAARERFQFQRYLRDHADRS